MRERALSRWLAFATLALLGVVQSSPHAQQLYPPVKVLSVQNGVFAADGTKQFIVFASYFGALRDAIQQPAWIVQNFDRFSKAGIRGVRIFGTWWNNNDTNCTNFDPRPLLKSNGYTNLDPLGPIPGVPNAAAIPPVVDGLPVYQPPGGYHNSVAGRFQFLLDVAYQKGLVVDVSFAVETVNGLWNLGNPAASLATYGAGLQGLANGLRTLTYNGPGGPQTGYRFAFFDVENEANYGIGCKPALSAAQILQLRNYTKVGDSLRLVTASVAADQEPSPAFQFLAGTQLDIVAYHDPRNPASPSGCGGPYSWVQMTTARILGAPSCGFLGWRSLTNDAIPIYFGEPERHRYNPASCNQNAVTPPAGCTDNFSTADFLSAVSQAKAAGAAAWTWHTEKLFRYQANYAPPLSLVEQNVTASVAATLAPVTWPR